MTFNEGYFVWNGKSSRDFGLYLSEPPKKGKAERKQDIISVPGKNGDLIIQQDAWKNIPIAYSVFTHGDIGNPEETIPEFYGWLSQSGYLRLEDSFDTSAFYLAYYAGGDDIDNIMDQAARGVITFNAKPQRYLKSGEKSVTYTSSGALSNPTPQNARPLISVTGTGTVKINDQTITISKNASKIMIDCEAMDAYGSDGSNANGSVSLPSADIVLKPGANNITLTGVTSVDVTPRWWTL